MRIKFILYLFLIGWKYANAQELKTDFSYQYLFAKQWDKAIQTYNFSRPFLAEKQPLLMHGLFAAVSYIFKSTKYVRHGINLSYSYFRSKADNENLNNTLHLHFLNPGYVLHIGKIGKRQALYAEGIISATTSGLFRNVNGKPYTYDEATSKAFGIGGNINLKFGYGFDISDKYSLSPFISFACAPYLYSPNSEPVLNQTKGLTSKNWTYIVSAQTGLSLHIKNRKY
jgi:hypothetical protein